MGLLVRRAQRRGAQGCLVKPLWKSLFVLVLCLLAFSCKRSTDPNDPKPVSAEPKAASLPPLSVKADSPNLLLTWIDDKGDFHVVQKPADVPVEGRKSVRVVQADKEAGTGELVYVANLEETAPDGSYRLKTLTRAQWDEGLRTVRQFNDLLRVLPPLPQGGAGAAAGQPARRAAAPGRPAKPAPAAPAEPRYAEPRADATRSDPAIRRPPPRNGRQSPHYQR